MRFRTVFLTTIILLRGWDVSGTEPADIPGLVTITATVREAPPDWAVMQRHLIRTINEAAPLYLDTFTFPGGTMREHGKIDDDYECFNNWALFYTVGGDDRFLDWSIRQWNAITRQWTYQHGKSVLKEFVKEYDMLHLSEGYMGFQYLGLADPDIPENIDRARRFAGFYLNEDPDAPNYDPQYRVIRSIATGSAGPIDHQGGEYTLKYGHASLYPFIKEPQPDMSRDPEYGKKLQELYDRVIVPCDSPINLAVTGLVAHAYILTGDEKYKNWVTGYVDAWMERIRENNGIIPDNIGRTGKIGEYRNGQWWGGFFGWDSRYSIEIMFNALITASEAAYLVSGDPRYLDLLRSQTDVLLSRAQTRGGNLLVPYRYGPNGWYDYRPMMPGILSHLWHCSLDTGDWERIERIRKGVKNGPHPYAYAMSPEPPAPGSEEWRPDGTILDWNEVVRIDDFENLNRLNEKPHLRFLAGDNPSWPMNILRAEYERTAINVRRITDKTYVHPWTSQRIVARNPVSVNGLTQMTMGAPFPSFNGGLLIAAVRYFDLERKRPGLPEDVAALVENIEFVRTVVKLVNTSALETRRLIVQAGAYGEHDFTTVAYSAAPEQAAHGNTESTAAVNRPFFAVELPPGTTIVLDIGTQRFVNRPGYAFPWNR